MQRWDIRTFSRGRRLLDCCVVPGFVPPLPPGRNRATGKKGEKHLSFSGNVTSVGRNVATSPSDVEFRSFRGNRVSPFRPPSFSPLLSPPFISRARSLIKSTLRGRDTDERGGEEEASTRPFEKRRFSFPLLSFPFGSSAIRFFLVTYEKYDTYSPQSVV